ncbi:MAG: M50 family metallopeptidase [Bacteroidales bacterium]|nr:M50 family metallopeptidase [Bacteroidales bacterium]
MSKYFIVIAPALVMIFIRLKPFDLILRTFYTLIHELSHALTAKIFSQKVQKIMLNKDFSGVCVTKVSNKKALFFISLAGYTLSSAAGWGLICLIGSTFTPAVFYILIAICIISVIFFIGNTFGRVWSISFAAANLIFVTVPFFKPYYGHIIYIYACILLIDNILSTLTLLYISLVKPNKAGDAAMLKKTTKIPAVFWSIFFFLFAAAMLILSIKRLA